MAKRGFGQIYRLPSRRYRARYTGPDGTRYGAPITFDTREDAEAWLASERRKISEERWAAPGKPSKVAAPTTFGAYSRRWLRRRDLKPRTRQHYTRLLDTQLEPLEDLPLTEITVAVVHEWYAQLDRQRPVLRAHAYGLLRTILGTAVEEENIRTNPCHIRGAGTARRSIKIRPATVSELETIAHAMPLKYQPMVMLCSWCGLRFGEVTELRRKDVDLAAQVLRIRRGVVRADSGFLVGTPKSDAGTRDVAIPPHLMPMLRSHLASMANRQSDALLFPAADGKTHMAPSTLYKVYYPARDLAGRPDLRWHDLRHTGAVLAAQTGATLAELMARLGHSTPQAALKYQHAARGRDAEIATALSRIAQPGLVGEA